MNYVHSLYSVNNIRMRILITLLFIFISTRIFALSYCVPAPANAVNGYSIASITLESLSATGDTSNVYRFYSDSLNSLTCFLHQGLNYSISISANANHSASTYAAWIDWNNDTTLSSSEKLGEFTTSSSGQTGNISFVVPANAVKGQLRMRIRCSNSSGITACTNYTSGQTTDFIVTILDNNFDYDFGTGWDYAGCGSNYIRNFSLGSIVNLNSGSVNGPLYNDFSRMSATINNCTGANLTVVTVAPASVINRCDVIVDVNDDGVFTANEIVKTFHPSTGTDTNTVSLVVPAVTGQRNLRIYFYTDAGLSEVEEYTMHFTNSTSTAAPTAAFGADLYSDCSGSCYYIGCAGSNSFYDLSCGVPTSWSWSVPGATPGQSTQQNPAFQFTPGTYTLTLICSNASGSDTTSATIRINAPFVNFRLGNDTSLCSGDQLTLFGPQPGGSCITYNWSNGSTADHINISTPGSYSLRVDTCSHLACAKTDSINITFSPLMYQVTGGGFYCGGATPPSVGLTDSETGISYQLLRNGIITGTPVSGTGHSISFGTQNQNGTYSVQATNSITNCTATMTDSVQITLNPLPQLFLVAGGGTFCSGAGAPVVLNGSNAGVNYQLYRDTIPAGPAIIGNGGTINFPPQYNSGTFTVIATNINTSCSDTMNGSVTVTLLPGPAQHTLHGGGLACSGSAAAYVGINSSDSGAVYLLYRDSVPTGDTLIGDGGPVTFDELTNDGNYSMVAYMDTSCTSPMTGVVNLTLKPSPEKFNVTGGGTYCIGGNAVAIAIDSSEVLVNYRLWTGGFPTGGVVPGTGSSLTISNTITPGTYNVVATNTSNGCSLSMNGNAIIITDSFPAAVNVTGGGSFCDGDSGVMVGLDSSVAGVSYSLLWNGDSTGITVQGTNGPISFGVIDSAGTFTAIATTTTNCSLNMNGSATTVVNPLPVCSVTPPPMDTICIYQSPLGLSASPAGGMLSGNGIINDTLYPQTAGEGNVIITYDYIDANGCAATSDDSVYVDMCIGIDENEIDNFFSVNPVPATDKLFLTFNSQNQKDVSIQLINVFGEILIEKKINCCEYVLDVSAMRSGIHFLRMMSGDYSWQKRIVISH
jgi:hypothetical protein